MPPRLKKHQRVTGDDRAKLMADVKRLYERVSPFETLPSGWEGRTGLSIGCCPIRTSRCAAGVGPPAQG